jgi:hypothetical protein
MVTDDSVTMMKTLDSMSLSQSAGRRRLSEVHQKQTRLLIYQYINKSISKAAEVCIILHPLLLVDDAHYCHQSVHTIVHVHTHIYDDYSCNEYS